MSNGWIKLHRQFIDWEWYTDINVKVLFLHCLLSANHETKKWRGITINKGQFITSIEHLANNTGLSGSKVRTALNKLKLTNEITCETTSQYSIITINKWDEYQTNDIQNDKPITNEQQTNDKQIATNKNDKNDKNIKNEKNIINNVSKKIDAYASKEVNTFIKLYEKYNKKVMVLNQTRIKIAQAIEVNGLDVMLEVIKKSANKGHLINNEFIPLSLENMLENAQKILDDNYNLVVYCNRIDVNNMTNEDAEKLIFG